MGEPAAVQARPSHTWPGRIVALTLLGAACVGAYYIGSITRSGSPPNAGLVVPESALNFGEVWEDPKFQWTVPIENRSRHEIHIEEFTSSCLCLAIEPKSLTIAAGETVNVKVTLNLTYRPKRGDATAEGSGFRSEQADQAVRDFAVPIVPHARNEAPVPGWTLHGLVKTAMNVTPSFLDLGETVRGESVPPKSATITALTSLESLTAHCEPPLGTARVTRSASNLNQYELRLEPKQTTQAGPLRFHVILDGTTSAGTKLPARPIRVEGIVLEHVQVVPATLQLAAAPVGETVRDFVLLRSLRAGPFHVATVEVDSPDIKIEPIAIAEDHGKAFRVSVHVSRPGHQSMRVRFVVRTGEEDEPLRISLPVSYHGVSSQ